MKCEIIFLACKPVRLCVQGVSNKRVCVCRELGFYVSKLGSEGKLEKLWKALGWGKGEDGKN